MVESARDRTEEKTYRKREHRCSSRDNLQTGFEGAAAGVSADSVDRMSWWRERESRSRYRVESGDKRVRLHWPTERPSNERV